MLVAPEKQRVTLEESRTLTGVQEMVEDALAQIVAHYQRADTLLKPSTITVTLTVTPDEKRQIFG